MTFAARMWPTKRAKTHEHEVPASGIEPDQPFGLTSVVVAAFGRSSNRESHPDLEAGDLAFYS